MSLLLEVGEQDLRQSMLCTAQHSSTFFSGLGTAELAWSVVGFALLGLGLPFALRPAFACDADLLCRNVLVHGPASHVFGDILGFVWCQGALQICSVRRKIQQLMGLLCWGHLGVTSVGKCADTRRWTLTQVDRHAKIGVLRGDVRAWLALGHTSCWLGFGGTSPKRHRW